MVDLGWYMDNRSYGNLSPSNRQGGEAVADNAQVKMLKEEGVAVWNKWRKANPRTRVDLRWADFREVSLCGASLIGADLRRANLCGADLDHAALNDADLRDAELNSADLCNADLRQTDLRGVHLNGADLSGANLGGANLLWVNFRGAKVTEADFSNCVMGATQLGNVDLSASRGLEMITHAGPSTIGIDTIYRSGGNIPEIFLRGAGVPEPFIIQMKSLVAAMSPIEFYSCFISYSSKDQEFAERLHADLRSKGVRCWFAPEDLKIGDKLRPSFDKAIQIHDKLMVLLSEHSVKSPWVEKEVETAFEKERQQNRTVLFPIRLDEAVMETKEAWAADIRRTRHIGDFRNWKDHDSYKKAYDRLLRDLKADAKAKPA